MINTASGKIYWYISLSSFRDKGKVWNLAKEATRERELAEIITLIQDKVVPLVDKYGTNLEEVLEEAILTGWFLPQANPMEFYVLEIKELALGKDMIGFWRYAANIHNCRYRVPPSESVSLTGKYLMKSN